MCFSSGFDSRRPCKKSLGGDAMRGMIKKNSRFSCFKMPDSILRREPEQGF